MFNSKKRLMICLFSLLILVTAIPLNATAQQPIQSSSMHQFLTDYVTETQRAATMFGLWNDVSKSKQTYIKTLVAPEGYHYEFVGYSYTYSEPKEVLFPFNYWERTKTTKYNYKLIAN